MSNLQDDLLKFLYCTVPGRVVLKGLTKPCVSKMAGRFLDSPLSVGLIGPFIRQNQIDISEYEEQVWRSYNSFFVRKIQKDKRPIDRKPENLISPCDSAVTLYPLKNGTHFSIKRAEYDVRHLLYSKRLAKKYAGGTAVVLRLDVTDYHRYCYIDAGRLSDYRRIVGDLHTVKPIANDYVPVYHENTREYCMLHSKNFGDVIVMEVGALMVGRIVNHYNHRYVKRGQEKGRFEFGGSTIILLFEKDAITWREDLLERSAKGIETPVKMGEVIGKKSCK